MLKSLPNASTKTFKVMQAMHKMGGMTFSQIQEFVCNLNGIDYNEMYFDKYLGRNMRLKRGYYSTNIARWAKIYIVKRGKQYVVRPHIADQLAKQASK